MERLTESPDIVVVEDNDDEARITILALRRVLPKPSAMVVLDGEHALTLLTGEARIRPQLIFLDLKLPKVHGLDVLKSLKADPESQSIPVVILSSSDHPRDVERAQELGCSEYICKPVDWEKYVKVVCEAVVRYLKGSTCTLDT